MFFCRRKKKMDLILMNKDDLKSAIVEALTESNKTSNDDLKETIVKALHDAEKDDNPYSFSKNIKDFIESIFILLSAACALFYIISSVQYWGWLSGSIALCIVVIMTLILWQLPKLIEDDVKPSKQKFKAIIFIVSVIFLLAQFGYHDYLNLGIKAEIYPTGSAFAFLAFLYLRFTVTQEKNFSNLLASMSFITSILAVLVAIFKS